jgi:hypothetical protein
MQDNLIWSDLYHRQYESNILDVANTPNGYHQRYYRLKRSWRELFRSETLRNKSILYQLLRQSLMMLVYLLRAARPS